MTRKSYRVAGDILNTLGSELATALADDRWGIRASDDEVEISGENIHLEIYVFGAGAIRDYDFLVSGNLKGLLTEVRARIDDIGARLERHGIRYRFELEDPEAPDGSRVTEHPNFSIKSA